MSRRGHSTETVQLSGLTLGVAGGVETFVLRALSGPDTGTSWSVRGARTVIGTHETAGVRLADDAVSRFHCEIVPGPETIIRDLNSKNRTRVDGVAIVEAVLADRAQISVGRTVLQVELSPERFTPELADTVRFGQLVGRSVAMRAVFSLLQRAAESDATVLLSGETGTGKEAAAESIHAASARADGPFVIVDCGAIPANLIEAELFGHEEGAFTGAVKARAGAFENASGGTIFLDEIGELGTELQPALLRALERRHVRRVGGAAYRPIDVRVIAATNRDLRQEVNAGTFRSDLYYRIAVIEAALPALRDRPDDLPLLVDHLLAQHAPGEVAAVVDLRSSGFLARLARHPWHGNVRELRNYLDRCIALRQQLPLAESPQGSTTRAAVGAVDTSLPFKQARDRVLEEFERAYLDQMLALQHGNVSAAARLAGLDRVYFYRLLRRHGLR